MIAACGSARTVLLSVVIAAAVLMSLAGAPPLARAAEDGSLSPQAEASFAEIAGCLAAGDELRVLFVVDESASLQGSDPQSQRTDGILAALDSLAVLQEAYPAKAINVAAATFAVDYVLRVGWGAAAGSHLDGLRAFATDDVPRLDDGRGTDYRAALNGAREDLQSDPEPACKIMLWFTDGALDVDGAEPAALGEICTPGGIADSARADGIHIVSAALFNPDYEQISDSDRATLWQIAEGEAAGGSCGTVPVPERYAGGAYVSANDPSQLSALFASLLALISGFTDTGSVECPGPQCVGGTYRFVIDPGIAWMRLIAVPVEGAPNYSLTDPQGNSAPVPANGTTGLGAVSVESSTAGSTTQIDVDLTPADQHGQWALNVKSGTARIGLFLLPGLQVALDPADQQLSAQDATTVSVRVTGPDQQPVDPAIYGSFTIAGSVDGAPLATADRAGDSWTLEVPPPPPGALPSTRQLAVSVDVVTTPTGIQLDPVVRQFVIPVSVSAYYPSLSSQELVMSPVEGDGASEGRLALTGSTEGPTTACISGVALSGPQGQDDVDATPEEDCVQLAAGGSGELVLRTGEFTVAADGSLTGDAQVTLTSVRADDEPITYSIPTRLSIARPVDETVRWLLVAGLLMLSLAIPLALIYFLGKRLARFETAPAEWLRVLRVPVSVQCSGTEARIMREGGPLRLVADDVAYSDPSPPHNKTRWTGAGVELATRFRFLDWTRIGGVRVPRLALEPTAAASGADGTSILVSSSNPYLHPQPPSAPCELRVERAWYLAFDAARLRALGAADDGSIPDSAEVPATLIVVRLDSDPGTVAARGEILAAQTDIPMRMLNAALQHARRTAPPDAPAQGVGDLAHTGGGPDWLTGSSATGRDPRPGGSGPSGSGSSGWPHSGGPTMSPPDDPERGKPDDTGLPDWLRG